MVARSSTCGKCDARTDGLKLCALCVVALRIELTDVAGMVPDAQGNGHLPSLGAELTITRTRQDQLTPAYDNASPSGERPLPMKVRASNAAAALHGVLDSWAWALGRPDDSAPSTAGLARWLLGALPHLQLHAEAGLAAVEITAAVHRARHAIDRPDDRRLYLGPCDRQECAKDVYGTPGKVLGRCEGCGACYDIEARRAWLLDVAQDYLGTATEIAAFLRVTGVRCTSAMVRGYAYRGTLESPQRNARGHPQYRICDVLGALPGVLVT